MNDAGRRFRQRLATHHQRRHPLATEFRHCPRPMKRPGAAPSPRRRTPRLANLWLIISTVNAVRGQPVQQTEHLIGLLRSEHRGGFVENQERRLR